jgi:hypothetical protein
MARDVEYDIIGRDKSGPGLDSAVRRAERAQKKIQSEQDKIDKKFGNGLTKAIAQVSPKLAQGLTRAMAGASEAAAPALAGVAIAAAPLIAATLSAAIIGGAGLGGVLGGVALVSKDARVAAAGKQLGTTLLSDLQSDASSFIRPVLTAVDTIGDRFEEVRGRIRSIFANSSQFVAPLVDGATRGLQGILRGVDALVANARPVIDVIANGLDRLGNDFGDFMTDIAGNSDGAARGLQQVFDQMSNILKITGPLIGGLTMIYGWLDKIGAAGFLFQQLLGPIGQLLPFLDKADEGARKVGSGTFGAAQGLDFMKQEAAAATEPVRTLAQKMSDAASAARSLYGATTSVATATANASKTIKENGRTVSLSTEKGRANRDALQSVADAMVRQYDASLKLNGVGAVTAAVADRNRAAFVRLAERAGYAGGKAQELATKLLGIPAKRDVRITAATAAAESRVVALQNHIDSLRGRTVTVTVHYRGDGSNENSPSIGGGGGRTFSAASYWAAVNGQATSRTGGPTPVNVQSAVRVDLDGRPFRSYTQRAIAESESRQAWRAKVGAR